MRSYQGLTYRGDLDMELHLPDEGPFSLFVYFHGGGLQGGGTYCKPFATTLCKRGIGVLSVQYRMYPKEGCGEVRYPMYIDDCAAAIRWAFDHIGEYGECRGIYAGGSSAGGYLSMSLCFNKAHLAAYGLTPTDLAGFIHDAGQPTTHFNLLAKEDGVDGRRVIVDERAPLYHVGIDPVYAPMLIIVSDADMQNRPEQTTLLLSTLRHFGHTEESGVYYRLMHGTHCSYVYETDEDGEGVFGKMIAEFIETVEAKNA
ncbi:MAG: alpha/beta hydrolase [Clostridia bacterium]|nr:alpha/beta hydrolase [Clostridia bacterium]